MPADDYSPSPEILGERVRTVAREVRELKDGKADRAELVALRESVERLERAVTTNTERTDKNTRTMFTFTITMAGAIVSFALGAAAILGGVGAP